MDDPRKAAAVATIAVGASQALVPRVTGRVFGMERVNDDAAWVAQMLGVAHLGLGALALDEDLRDAVRPVLLAVLAGDAVVTALAAVRGRIRVRTAVAVTALLGAVAAGNVADL